MKCSWVSKRERRNTEDSETSKQEKLCQNQAITKFQWGAERGKHTQEHFNNTNNNKNTYVFTEEITTESEANFSDVPSSTVDYS